MSPSIRSCTICGCDIFHHLNLPTWQNQFRGLYSGPEGVILTGVGLYNEPHDAFFIAPTSYSARWDDPEYKSPEKDAFGATGQSKIRSRQGFFFHEACWSLLEKFFEPQPVPLTRLLEVCNSLPFPIAMNGISWEHDYEIPTRIDDENYYPWEDFRFFGQQRSEADAILNANPSEAVDIEQMIAENTQAPPETTLAPASATQTHTHILDTLPQELCMAVVRQIPTTTFLNARQAVRSFGPIFHSQYFWASRFTGSSDRAWLFEARNSKPSQDWRALYRGTNNRHLGPALRNRKRIWRLIQKYYSPLSLCWNELPGASPLWDLDAQQSAWVEAAGDLWEPEVGPLGSVPTMDQGCRRFYRQQIKIPSDLALFSVSVVRFGKTAYVCGIKLTDSLGNSMQIGYWGAEQISARLSSIEGFNLAIGSRGIHAVQCITKGNNLSDWLGHTKDAPKTARLTSCEQLVGLEAGFDGCKMVSLSVCRRHDSPTQTMETSNRLRQSGLWYPEIPAPDLHLNESSFLPHNHYTDGYKPLFWTSFGGPGGIYLRHLTKISATFAGDLQRIDFTYNTDVPIECCSLGRCETRDPENAVDFLIDGPGGEVIDAIEVHQYYPEKTRVEWLKNQGILRSFKLSTNRGRSCLFSRRPEPSDGVALKPLMVTPGTTITGFYSTRRTEQTSGFLALGVISERL